MKKRAVIYESAAFYFLAGLYTSEKQVNESVRLLVRYSPDAGDVNLTRDIQHFNAYIKENYVDKGHLHYQVIIQDTIHLAFPNVESI